MPTKKKKPARPKFTCTQAELQALQTAAALHNRSVSQEIHFRCFPPSK